MKIEVTVDRFEGAKAVLLYGENSAGINWPQELLPADVQEGDILSITIKKNERATQKSLQKTEKLLRSLLEQT